jgi:pimeloyl-ACP methyl ester carboxylesterase
MKANKQLFKSLLFFSIAAISVSSCNKDEGPDYQYFVSSELLLTYTEANISSLLTLAVQSYPEINEIQPFIKSGVNVYKMVYLTAIGDEKIEASGLVCVPGETGKYPVLSFQNGTNTRHDYAPSERVNDVSYTLIESIASMGFIVVIPDYPGFGSSQQIPHPYLIAEPTLRSIVDMLYALSEGGSLKFPGITIENEYYLLGYSQGGWATLTLHKSLELDYPAVFNLKGSVCGAGSYNMYNLFTAMISADSYPMPSYLGYIINAYSAYNQFTNPVTGILNEPYATRLGSLYTGNLSLDQINNQLTTSISGLFKPEFLAGFSSSQDYSSVREALVKNSITPWKSVKPLLFVHGENDTHVSVTATETMYSAMIGAGTSTATCEKLIFPGLDHGDGVVPCMTEGLVFLINLRDQ